MEPIKANEISDIIRQQIENFEGGVTVTEVGTVIKIGDGIAEIHGLEKVMAGELLELPHGVRGLALNLEEDKVGAVLFGEFQKVKEGDTVKRTGRIMEVPVGDALVGRVVNALGLPEDDRGPIITHDFNPIERIAPGVVDRQPVKEPLQTGLKAIDSMVPIGRGQRELIIGDRQTGKTAVALDTIINQRGKDVICIYVAIGQKASTVAQVVKTLQEFDAMSFSIVGVASASDPAAMQYLAPYAGAAIGEYFRDHGKHVLTIYDDLSKQAAAYREISLLLRRPPGREAYPGDVFDLHSRLLERASKLSDAKGGGSLTSLPIIETQAGLARGQRLMEILKQPQYQPMPVEKQVLIIWAATNGYLDAVPVDRARAFEAYLHNFVENSHPGLLNELREKKALTDEIKADLKTAITDFKQTWGSDKLAPRSTTAPAATAAAGT